MDVKIAERTNFIVNQITTREEVSEIPKIRNLAQLAFAIVLTSYVVKNIAMPVLQLDPRDFPMIMSCALTTFGMGEVSRAADDSIRPNDRTKRAISMTILAAISSGLSGLAVVEGLKWMRQPVSYKMLAAAMLFTPAYVTIFTLFKKSRERHLLPVYIQDV